MSKAVRVLISVVVIGAVFGGLGDLLNRTESTATLTVTGLGLLLAWYSILDLQEQRKERFWPHTFDRLVHASFVSATLALAAHISFSSGTQTQLSPPHVCRTQPPTSQVFADALRKLSKYNHSNTPDLHDIANQ